MNRRNKEMIRSKIRIGSGRESPGLMKPARKTKKDRMVMGGGSIPLLIILGIKIHKNLHGCFSVVVNIFVGFLKLP